MSRGSSFSNLADLRSGESARPSDLFSSAESAEALTASRLDVSPLRWSTLKRLAARVKSSANLGQPTVLAASALICLGTDGGYVLVFDYSQALRCVCGNESIGK